MHIGKAGKWGSRADLRWVDFSLAKPKHVDELNAMANALRTKAAHYTGQTIGGIAISGDVRNAAFQANEPERPVTIQLPLRIPCRQVIAHMVPR
jgi:hypothetical protein